MTEQRPAGNPLWIAYEYVVMLVGLSLLALICLIWMPFALILHPLLPQRLGQPLGRAAITACFRSYLFLLKHLCACRFDLTALDQLRDEGPLILVANHPSLLDVVLIVSRLPNVVCVMKAALMNNILFGSAARLARYIRNDTLLTIILHAREEVRDGAQLLIFPEGTRTTHFPLDACTPSTGLIAKRTRIPVQTLLIELSTPYLGKAWPLFRRPSLPLTGRVRLGRRFAPPDDVEAFTRELETYFSQELGGASTPAPATP
ncbi:MAG: lysophospholipid acyltransferase family protein [Azonexus sp.]